MRASQDAKRLPVTARFACTMRSRTHCSSACAQRGGVFRTLQRWEPDSESLNRERELMPNELAGIVGNPRTTSGGLVRDGRGAAPSLMAEIRESGAGTMTRLRAIASDGSPADRWPARAMVGPGGGRRTDGEVAQRAAGASRSSSALSRWDRAAGLAPRSPRHGDERTTAEGRREQRDDDMHVGAPSTAVSCTDFVSS